VSGPWGGGANEFRSLRESEEKKGMTRPPRPGREQDNLRATPPKELAGSARLEGGSIPHLGYLLLKKIRAFRLLLGR